MKFIYNNYNKITLLSNYRGYNFLTNKVNNKINSKSNRNNKIKGEGMKNEAEMRKGLEAKREIETILEKYKATLFYRDMDGTRIENIYVYKKGCFEEEVTIKDYGDLYDEDGF